MKTLRLSNKTTRKIAKMLLGEDKKFEWEFIKKFQQYILEKHKSIDTCVLYAHSVEFVVFLEENGYTKLDLGRREVVIINNCIKYTCDYSREPEPLESI